MGVSAAAYWDDPDRGAGVFYTRGLLGGYMLAIEDFEPIGLWAAFPIATVLSWSLARGLAWAPYHFVDWNYALVFSLVLGAYTLLALVPYVVLTLENDRSSSELAASRACCTCTRCEARAQQPAQGLDYHRAELRARVLADLREGRRPRLAQVENPAVVVDVDPQRRRLRR
jgi:hypothetical protein